MIEIGWSHKIFIITLSDINSLMRYSSFICFAHIYDLYIYISFISFNRFFYCLNIELRLKIVFMCWLEIKRHLFGLSYVSLFFNSVSIIVKCVYGFFSVSLTLFLLSYKCVWSLFHFKLILAKPNSFQFQCQALVFT